MFVWFVFLVDVRPFGYLSTTIVVCSLVLYIKRTLPTGYLRANFELRERPKLMRIVFRSCLGRQDVSYQDIECT